MRSIPATPLSVGLVLAVAVAGYVVFAVTTRSAGSPSLVVAGIIYAVVWAVIIMLWIRR